jgi:hypothetical protein
MFATLVRSATAVIAAAALLSGVVAATTSQPARANVNPITTPDIGAQFHGMWANYTETQRIYVLDALKYYGATTVRIDVSWAMLQPTNATTYDAWGRLLWTASSHCATRAVSRR